MRDSARLDNFYEDLCYYHKTYFPDWRFGQLCSNFFGWLMAHAKVDLFFPEEDEMLAYLDKFIDDTYGRERRFKEESV